MPRSTPAAHWITLTIAPARLLNSSLEGQVEFRLVEHLGLGLLGGGGVYRLSDEDAEELESPDVTVWDVGGRLSFYPLAAFDGLVFGSELIYASGGFDSERVAATAKLTRIGLFIGYKLTLPVGFSFLAHSGASYEVVVAEATDGLATQRSEEDAVVPLLNLNLGWSF